MGMQQVAYILPVPVTATKKEELVPQCSGQGPQIDEEQCLAHVSYKHPS